MVRRKAETTVVKETTITATEKISTEESRAIAETQSSDETAELNLQANPEPEPADNIPQEVVHIGEANHKILDNSDTSTETSIKDVPKEDMPIEEIPEQAPLRRNAQQRIITIDGKVYDGRSKQISTAAEMRRHIQRGSTLTGNLFAIDQTSGGMPFGIVLYEELRVIIPANELIDLNKVEVNDDTTLEREVNAILYGMLDAEISYIPKGIDARNGIVTASRREAAEKQVKRFYLTPIISGEPLIVENGLAEGKIIRVTLHTVTIDLFGVDVTIPGEELSWSWLNDAREIFHVGETVVVRVLHIDCNGNELSVSASIRQAKKDPFINLDKKFQPQRLYVGEIQSPGNRFIRVSLGDLDCTCPYPDWMDTVIPGTKVSVKIISINKELHSIRGSITRVIKEV